MKRILAIAIASLAMAGAANAQDEETEYVMQVKTANGKVTTFEISDIDKVMFTERPDGNAGWTSLGYCLYGEDFLGSYLYRTTSGDLCCEYYVEVLESDDEPGLYRLVNPYSPDVYPFAYLCSYDTDSDHYLEINATDPDGVYVDYQDTGMYWDGFGEYYVYSYAAYWYDEYRYDRGTIKDAGYCGTLKDGVITFPVSCLLNKMSTDGEEDWYLANVHNGFKLDLNDRSEAGGAKSPRGTFARGATTKVNGLAEAGRALPALP